jgi:hypothetical protein
VRRRIELNFVIASEAKQSSIARADWIVSSLTLLAMTELDNYHWDYGLAFAGTIGDFRK